MSGMVSQPARANVNVPATRKRKRAKGPLKRHHWFHGVVMVTGWIVPPLAVLIRFGVGLDFFINIIMTVCGYIPGHFHNFWIQNIRNNSNERHSPRWAVKAGLVKDYNKAKLKTRGWAGRYEDDGLTQGGASYHGQKRWEAQEVVVDPVTGETRTVQRQVPASQSQAQAGEREHIGFPSPWANDPLREPQGAERDYDDDDDDDDGPEDAGRGNYGRSGGGGSSSRSRQQRSSNGNGRGPAPAPPIDNRKRDSVTGAIIDDFSSDDPSAGNAGNARLQRSPSGKSLHDAYAERYNLGAGGSRGASSVSLSLKSKKSKTKMNGGGGGRGDEEQFYAPGELHGGQQDAGAGRARKKSAGAKVLGGLFGGGGEGKKKGEAPEPEDADGGAYGSAYESGHHAYQGDYGRAERDRRQQNGSYHRDREERRDSAPVQGDGLQHQF